MAEYRIVEDQHGKYWIGEITNEGKRAVLILATHRMLRYVQAESLDDIMHVRDFEDVIYDMLGGWK